MNLFKKDKGVTLIALIITIIILLVLVSTATLSGTSTIQSARMTTFITEMKLIESKVGTDSNGNKTINGQSLSDKGEVIDSADSEINQMKTNMQTVWNVEVDLTKYKYFDSDKLNDELGIEGITRVVPVIINVEDATIISVNGVKYEGKFYYTLDQTPDNLNKVSKKEISQDAPTFEITTESTADEMKILLSNIEVKAQYVKKYKVEYQLDGNSNWITIAENLTADNYSFIVNSSGKYNVKIVDSQNNESIIQEVEVI